MGKKVETAGNAERLLDLHDELDVLDRKESYAALSVVLFVIATVLIVVGMSRGSAYLEVNGLFLSFGGVIFGVKEVSKRLRMKALARKVAEIEQGGWGAGSEGAIGGPGERRALGAPD